jgi:hypothetical protein
MNKKFLESTQKNLLSEDRWGIIGLLIFGTITSLFDFENNIIPMSSKNNSEWTQKNRLNKTEKGLNMFPIIRTSLDCSFLCIGLESIWYVWIRINIKWIFLHTQVCMIPIDAKTILTVDRAWGKIESLQLSILKRDRHKRHHETFSWSWFHQHRFRSK